MQTKGQELSYGCHKGDDVAVSEDNNIQIEGVNKLHSKWSIYDCRESGHQVAAPVPKLRWKTDFWTEKRILEQEHSCLKCGESKWVRVEVVGHE